MNQTNNQAANPLEQLKDIHLPEPISAWQLAPGWWLLVVLLITFTGYIAFRWHKRRIAFRLLKPAQLELKRIGNLPPNNDAIAELSALIKRVCLVYFPTVKTASLSGTQWIAFLNSQTESPIFDESSAEVFTHTAYRANQTLPEAQWKTLITQSRTIINTIIHNSVKAQHKGMTQDNIHTPSNTESAS